MWANAQRDGRPAKHRLGEEKKKKEERKK